MKIKISGGNAHQRKNVESLVEFCSDKLMSKRLANSIKLDIRLSRTYLKTHGDYGCCEWQDDCHRPKEFKMWVDSAQNPREFYSTVAHEMVHLYQMTVLKDPYSNHNANFYSFRDRFKSAGLKLYR